MQDKYIKRTQLCDGIYPINQDLLRQWWLNIDFSLTPNTPKNHHAQIILRRIAHEVLIIKNLKFLIDYRYYIQKFSKPNPQGGDKKWSGGNWWEMEQGIWYLVEG